MTWLNMLRELALIQRQAVKVDCADCLYLHRPLDGTRPGCAHLAHAATHPTTGSTRLGNHRWINRDGHCSDHEAIPPPVDVEVE